MSFRKFRAALLAVAMTVPLMLTACADYGNSSSFNDSAIISSSMEDSSSSSKIDSDDSSVIAAQTNSPLIWKVTLPDSDTTLYLFGSIHAAKEDVFPLNKVIRNAYADSDYLAVECDTIAYAQDTLAQMEMSQMMVYSDGSTIEDHLSAETFKKVKKYLLDTDSFNSNYVYFKPALFESLLSNAAAEKSGMSSEYGIDESFPEMARFDDKEIIEVESIESQMQMITTIPDGYYDISLSMAVDSLLEEKDPMGELYRAWIAGDIDYFEKQLFEESPELTDEQRGYLEEYNQAMLTDRNKLMADVADEIFKDGKNCFYVVGLAHMIGEDGIVALLEDMGYTVTRI